MKVLRVGQTAKVPYQLTCKDCKSLLEVTAKDGRLVSDSRDGDAYVFKCPICKTDNWVSASFIGKVRPSAGGQQG